MSPSQKDHYDAYTKMELSGLECELKDWFLSRRLEMERALSIKKALDGANFTGRGSATDSEGNMGRPDIRKTQFGQGPIRKRKSNESGYVSENVPASNGLGSCMSFAGFRFSEVS
ncbi:unnamed protein product [Amoebophrya sp. A25]|nr:unnamed protein product [Amoebophrya sp. A25]|eukprot:GSA25T00008081001.1